MKSNKAISPILATVILIAVTLIVAIAVIGWIMGVWGSLGGPSESLVVVGSSATCSDNELEFTLGITNKGTANAEISRIEVLGVGSSAGTSTISKGTSTDVTVTVTGTGSFTCPTVGSTYQVNVYTKAGNVYTTVIKITESGT